MADEKSDKNGRKSARAKRATKRDEGVLEEAKDGGEKEVKKIETPKKAATKRDGDGAAESGDKPEKKAATATRREEKPEEEDQGDPIERGEAWLNELFTRMKYDLTVKGKAGDDNYVFNLSGPDTDDLIGRSRQSPRVLQSIQTLLAEHLGRSMRDKVVVDLGGFKQERKKHLTGMADKLGETASRLGKPLTVAGLNRYERRVIHERLDEKGGVDTESVGDGIFRKLRVLSK